MKDLTILDEFRHAWCLRDEHPQGCILAGDFLSHGGTSAKSVELAYRSHPGADARYTVHHSATLAP